jgi:hypothetical protein
MPGIADLLFLGQPDPARQLAAMLSGQQPQGAPPQGAAPQGGGTPSPPGGAAADPNAPAPNAQPVNAVAPGAQPPPGSPPQPQALQSTPDMSASYSQLANPPNLMSLYLQLQQRQQASDQINRGLALITANHSPPSMRQAIMESMIGGGQDAGQTVNNLLGLYQGQQQMAAQQQLLQQAPAIAQKLGMDEGTVRAEIMAGRGPDLIKGLETIAERQAAANLPTEQIRTLTQARDLYRKSHPGATDDEVEAAVPTGLFVGSQGGDALTSSWLKARAQVPPAEWPDHPELKDALTYSLYTQDQKKRQDNVDAAAGAFGQYNGGLMDVRGKVAAIQSNPELKNVLQNPVLVSAVKTAREGGVVSSLSAAAQSAFAHATDEQKQLVNDILDLSDPEYIKALQGKSSAATQGDVLPITTALSALGRLGTAPKQYGGLLNSALEAVDNARGNAYGASGQLDLIPDNDEGDALRQRVSEAYLPGGASFVGHGKPIPSDQLAKAQQAIKTDPTTKAAIVSSLRRHGYNTKPIE